VLRYTFGLRTDEVTGEWRKLHNEELSDLFVLTIHHHHYHHLANMQMCHLLNCSVLTHPEVSSAVSPFPSACWSVVYLVLSWIYCRAFCLYIAKSSFCFTVFCHNKCIINFYKSVLSLQVQIFDVLETRRMRLSGHVTCIADLQRV